MAPRSAAARAALARDDAWAGLEGYVRDCVSFGSGGLAPLAGTIQTAPRMRETSRLGRRLLDELVTRELRQGVLRPDVTALDVAWLAELFGHRGPARPGAEDDRIDQRLLAIALDGLRAPGTIPLPGPRRAPATTNPAGR